MNNNVIDLMIDQWSRSLVKWIVRLQVKCRFVGLNSLGDTRNVTKIKR